MKVLNRLAILLFVVLGVAVKGFADSDKSKLVFTPGYFLDQRQFDGVAHRYYHDYELEKGYGVTPSISPYIASSGQGTAILDLSGHNTQTFTVKDTGRYVDTWNIYTHGFQVSQPKAAFEDHPKSITISYSDLAGISSAETSFDIIPLLKMINYTLAYNANGGVGQDLPTTTTYIWSNAVTVASADCVSRKGYTFDGWNTAAKGTGIAIAAGETLDNPSGGSELQVDDNGTNVTLYAQWKANPYSLHLKPGVGIEKIFYVNEAATSPLQWKSTTTNLTVSVDYGSTWYAYAVAKPGYSYTSSSSDHPYSATMDIVGATFAPSATTNSLAISYVGNGATSGLTSSSTFVYNQSGYLQANGFSRAYTVTFDANGFGVSLNPSSAVATYSFAGWNSEADGTGAYTYADEEQVTNPCGLTGGSARLYAQWTSGSVGLPYPTRTGYTFLGWSTKTDGEASTSSLYPAGARYTPTKNVTLYAQWSINSYTATFVDSLAASNLMSTVKLQAVNYGGTATTPTPPSHSGYKFTGWTSVQGDSLSITADTTFTAQYEAIGYHVTYHSNYGEGRDISVLSAGCGPGSEEGVDKLSLLSAESMDIAFSKEGYVFCGWSWTPDAADAEWQAGSSMAWNVIDEHIGSGGTADLYAIWQPITYTMVYLPGFELLPGDYNGGATNQTLAYNQPARLLANPYQFDHQRFCGWKVLDVQSASSTSTLKLNHFSDQQEVTNLTTVAGTVITLTAVWDGAGDHYVAFAAATNSTITGICGTMAAQTFCGTNAQHLASNCYTRVGYTFSGWATNNVDGATTNWSSAVYNDRDVFAFATTTPRHATNTLYAVWEPIKYRIIFNTGTNYVFNGETNYATGTIAPTNCVYDELPLKLPNCSANFNNYKNQFSGGFVGWSLTRGGGLVVRSTNSEDSCCYVISNLTTKANDCLTLYAVWDDIGELSRAVGLTNAVLLTDKQYFSGNDTEISWGTNKTSGQISCIFKGEGKSVYVQNFNLSCELNGSGRLDFQWCKSSNAEFKLCDGNQELVVLTNTEHGVWQNFSTNLAAGVHTNYWQCNKTIKNGDTIALKEIRWTPDENTPMDWPEYRLTYSGTNEVDAAIINKLNLPSAYAVTNDTFVIPPIEQAAGSPYQYIDAAGVTNVFAGWMPPRIENGTTGDIMVEAQWKKFLPVADTNTTDKTELTIYRIDYRAVPVNVINTNATGFTVTGAVTSIFALDNTREQTFVGWTGVYTRDGSVLPGWESPSQKGSLAATNNVTLTAVWSNRTWHTVTFVLGEHLARTGGGAVRQEVEHGESTLQKLEVQADEGYSFMGWKNADGTTVDPSTLQVERNETLTAEVQVQSYQLQVGENDAAAYPYGTVITNNAPFNEVKSDGMNIVYVGYRGSGNVPASGSSTQVVFKVTGEGSLQWVYMTNYWVSVVAADVDELLTASQMGSVTVKDSVGGIMATNEFWASAGSEYTAIAQANSGYRFVGWEGDALDDRSRSDVQVNIKVSEPIARKAYFETLNKPQYTVSFNLGEHLQRTGGGELVQTIEQGQFVTNAPTVAADEGYVFVGWRTNGIPVEVESVRVASDLTFAAAVTQCVYTVTFVLDERLTRTGGGELVQTVAHGQSAVPPTVEAAAGYEFAGWYADGVQVDVASARVTADVTLTAVATVQYTETPYLSLAVAPGCELMGTVSGGNKIVKAGKKVSVRATAKKGYLLVGWYENDECVETKTSYSFKMPSHDVTLQALFISKAKEAESVRVKIAGMDLFAGREDDAPLALDPATNISTGVYLEWPLVASAEVGITVKVSGLPSGLKFTAKTVTDRTTGRTIPANTIYGTPTAGGKTSTVKVTVTTAGKNKVIGTMKVTVEALPTWLVATYNGGSTNAPGGYATLTVAKTAKISGKWISEGATWKLTGSGFNAIEEGESSTKVYYATVTAKSGKITTSLRLAFSAVDAGLSVIGMVDAYDDEGWLFGARAANWKTAPWKPLASQLRNATFAKTMDSSETTITLTGKVGANGTVKVAGVFGSYKASASATLEPLDEDRYELFVYYPPKATKGFAGYAACLILNWDGIKFTVE